MSKWSFLTLEEVHPHAGSVSNKESGSLIRPHIGLHSTFPQPLQDRTCGGQVFLISVIEVEDALLYVVGKNGEDESKTTFAGKRSW